MGHIKRCLGSSLILALGLLACGSPPGPDIRVRNVRTEYRAGIMIFVYLDIKNEGDSADSLTGVHCNVANRVIIGRFIRNGGKTSVDLVSLDQGVEIPAKGLLRLGPNENYVMLLDLDPNLQTGDPIVLTFDFQKSSQITIQTRVRQPWQRPTWILP